MLRLSKNGGKNAKTTVKNMLFNGLGSMTAVLMVGLLALSILTGAGCGKSDSVNGPNNLSDNNSDNTGVEQLSFFEEQLVGLWSRYHAYDGSSMYIYFNGDRTACKWEEANGSNTRQSSRSYSNWYLDEDNPVGDNVFTIVVEGAGISYRFDYADDELWPESYHNLTYYSSSEGKSCE